LACAGTIEQYLDQFTRSLKLPPNLVEAIRYALLGGGKRLRPVLAWNTCEAVGGPAAQSLPAAGALELIHAFSLVHDDLPALDNDDMRRGRATLHVHAGEAMAILAGDAMMALAFEHLAQHCPAGRSSLLVQELSTATTAMIAGQVFDTLGGFPEGISAAEKLGLIHRNKTGALIRAACRMGAIAGDADTQALADVTRYGEAIGLMFQIVDDLLDVEATAQQTGKKTGKDAQAGKTTYPGILGVERSRQEVVRLQHEALEAVRPLGMRAEPLRELCRLMAERDR
jgi:geranylgeranyl diphosphate synthase, type II